MIDSTAEVAAAIASGTAVDLGVVKQFECPVIPLPRNRSGPHTVKGTGGYRVTR